MLAIFDLDLELLVDVFFLDGLEDREVRNKEWDGNVKKVGISRRVREGKS